MSPTRAASALRRIALAILAAGLLRTGSLRADDAAPDAAGADPAEALATAGLEHVASGDPELERVGVRELVFAGATGTRRAIDALARAAPPLRARLALVAAVSASDDPAADAALVAQTSDPRFEVRALAAHGLGLGRTPAATAALARLAASDPIPGVRAAALRALFALDAPEAAAARAALPRDPSPVLRTRRAVLHRLRGDHGPEVAARAAESYLAGETADERVAGARLAVTMVFRGSPALERLVIAEYGGSRLAAWLVRRLLRVRDGDADPAESRLAAAEALVAHLTVRGLVPDVERDATLRLAVEWIAHPARIGGRRVDDEARTLLQAALPDLAADPRVRAVLVDALVGELRRNRFDDPAHAVQLLRALGEATALPAFASLADPGHVPKAVLGHVSGALRDLRRIGDEATARRLLAPTEPDYIRRDAVEALAGEPWTLAGPLLCGLADDPDDGVASVAATVLLGRKEPEARARLDALLLDRAWRPFEQGLLHALCAPADDAAYALLERLLREGTADARRALFIEVSAPSSPLRGERAVGLVRLAIERPELGIDVGTIATALSSVDGPAAVGYVRANWARVTRPGVLLRNLHVVADPAAIAFALEIAAATRDDDDRMLAEIVAVLSGRTPCDPPRTDPFWRRLLAKGSPEMRRVAIRALTYVEHGPMAAWLVPFLLTRDEASTSRRDALAAMERGGETVPEATLWRLAADRTEDEDVRIACATSLVPGASDATRARATEWLAECVEEPSEAVAKVAEVAGTSAPPARVERLVALFRGSLDARFRTRPYLRPASPDDDERARANRVPALATALAVSGDPAALDALADSLLDPRYAVYGLETRRVFAMEHEGAGGPLSSASAPIEQRVSLRDPGSNPAERARAPLPAEFEATVGALVRAESGAGLARIADRLARARADGRLARFDDLFVSWIARRVATNGPGDDVARTTASVAFPAPARRDGPEAIDDLDRRSEAAQDARDFAEAARLGRAALAAGARTGVFDLPPSRWLDAGRTPPPSWSLRRARVSLLDAAAVAVTGDAARARPLFAAATARERHDPRIFVEAARIRLAAGADPADALADARRAVELARRQGEEPAPAARRALAAARRAAPGATK